MRVTYTSSLLGLLPFPEGEALLADTRHCWRVSKEEKLQRKEWDVPSEMLAQLGPVLVELVVFSQVTSTMQAWPSNVQLLTSVLGKQRRR